MVDAVEQILELREDRLAEGVTLGQRYDSFAEPGRNVLREVHEELDAAVFEIYGFDAEEDELAQLLALNESISAEEQTGFGAPPGPGAIGLASATRTAYRIE